jgi:hypothetical protein
VSLTGGAMQITDANNLALGPVNTTGGTAYTATSFTLLGNITTNNNPLILASPVTLSAPVTIGAGSGDVSFGSTVNGANAHGELHGSDDILRRSETARR